MQPRGNEKQRKREERMFHSAPLPEGKRDAAPILPDTVFTSSTLRHIFARLISGAHESRGSKQSVTYKATSTMAPSHFTESKIHNHSATYATSPILKIVFSRLQHSKRFVSRSIFARKCFASNINGGTARGSDGPRGVLDPFALDH
ncbi:hypothetical protein EVAR_45884_1 [Eumeta japonica]|uniref:Uncharacterized protein n=1 Tax=Eumeta variegata TaxID=151549 RepID=A0A4C1XTS1_EUMVA|nr:hypothetical protein EVAR_45884_1 [Eumeta japonica]